MKKMLVGIAVAAAAATTLALPAAGGNVAKLTIVHVTKGCHVFSNGKAQSPQMTLTLHRGARLVITNQDVDMHRLVQQAGPRLGTFSTIMMNGTTTLTFAKAGVYRFGTKVSAMKGMPDVKTIGPDNVLRLTVRVS